LPFHMCTQRKIGIDLSILLTTLEGTLQKQKRVRLYVPI